MKTKITNIVMTPGVTGAEEHISFIRDAEIQIEGNRIIYAGSRINAPDFLAEKVIDGQGQLAMPGLCNMHTHTAMTILRSAGNDLNLQRWLNEAIFPLEKHLTDDSVRAGSQLGVLEMLRFGTTSFNDMYMHMDMLAETVRDSGIRAMLGYCAVDFNEDLHDIPPGIEFIEKWKDDPTGRIRLSICPHAEFSTTPPAVIRIKQIADQYKIPIHVHVSETRTETDGCRMRRGGMTPPEYFESLGLMENQLICAHCVWFTEHDIELCARNNVFIAHNPISNLKLASGIAPVGKMLKAGCHVTLATDGVASNNNLNLWEEMKLMPMLQKGADLDATEVSPVQVLAAVTSVAGKAMGYSDLGLLKPGYLADIILVNVDQPHIWPQNDLETEIIYSAQGSDVTMTMVDGKVLYQDGHYFTLDPTEVKAFVQQERDILYKKAEK